MTVDTELTKSVETALAAFNEYKTLVEGIKIKTNSIAEKVDALDLAKLDKLGKDMGDAIELSQKAEAKAKAAEEKQKEFEATYKALEAELSGLKTAFNRAPADDGKAAGEKTREAEKKLFNAFARKNTSRQEAFHEYLR
ncbi:MAG TPA: phage major capsid protein, partial [Urbifossiella sp.]|nr:phage major capsid protein [Urbifossiella sp.]